MGSVTTGWKIVRHANRVIKDIEIASRKRMIQAVHVVRNEELRLLRGTRSGKTYKVPGTKREYKASKPGEPPATATGRMRGNVITDVVGTLRGIEGRVGFPGVAVKGGSGYSAGDSMKYPAILDDKTRLNRPHLTKAFENTRNQVAGLLSRRWF